MHKTLMLAAALLLCSACAYKEPSRATVQAQSQKTAARLQAITAAQGLQVSKGSSPRLEPVENPPLVQAITAFLASRSEADRQRMYAALNSALYLIPMQRQPDGEKRYAKFELPGVGLCMPAFTDFDEVAAGGMRGQQLDVMVASRLWGMMDHSGLDCVLVNPGGEPLPLRRPIIRKIRAS